MILCFKRSDTLKNIFKLNKKIYFTMYFIIIIIYYIASEEFQSRLLGLDLLLG